MTTDKTLDAWKRWLAYSISKEGNSPLAGMVIQLRDSEEVKTYPGIYIEEGNVDRITPGGVMDGNSWEIEIITKLVTTPGDDDQIATSKAAHDALRLALSAHVNACGARQYLDSQLGMACHQINSSSPKTTEEDGYRVTAWSNDTVVCLD